MADPELLKISELFDISYGVNQELVRMNQCKKADKDAVPFVSRTRNNNGVSAYVKLDSKVETNPPHTLSVAGGGSPLATFYQPLSYCSGRDIYILTPKKKTGLIEMLFFAKCISENAYKYSYGRQANRTLKDILIPSAIPKSLKENLASFYRHKFVGLSNLPKAKLNRPIQIHEDVVFWQEFKLTDLFDIEGSKTTPLLELEEYGNGSYPYITTQATNNGTRGFFDYFTESEDVFTIDSAVLGYCSYQSEKFSASDHVEKLIPKFKLNKYIAMFLVTVLNAEQYRYNYGRKCSQSRMKDISVKLPAKKDRPDWHFMESYIKSLPYSSNL